jgi:hypothetical protein
MGSSLMRPVEMLVYEMSCSAYESDHDKMYTYSSVHALHVLTVPRHYVIATENLYIPKRITGCEDDGRPVQVFGFNFLFDHS